MRPRSHLALVVGPIAVVTVACGSDGVTSADDGPRTVEIEMRDIAFAPDRITVPAGEEVRLVFRNTGKVDHDAFIGSERAQVDHEEEMASGDGDMRHGDGGAVTVEPGETGTLTHTFEAGEEVLIGCHQRGHYDGGMKITLTAS